MIPLRTRNILKLSGGVDTRLKVKDKTKSIIYLVIFLSLALGIGYGIYYLADVVFNGSFLDWIAEHYFYIEDQFDYAANMIRHYYHPNWHKIKELILTLFFIQLVVFVVSVYLISHFYAKSQVKKSISKTSRMLLTYMHHDIDSNDVFPPSYMEVASQIVQIKSTMQRHEQAMRDETARRNDLITYLAHDLKTPLTSVISYLDLLEEAFDMPETQKKKYIHITLEKALRLEKLINEFFEITRYNLQQIVLEKETIDLSFMLMQLTDEFYPLLTNHGNTIELQAEEGLTVYGDSMKLARVFNNILKNAISYSYPNSPIKVFAGKREKDIFICFINQGKTIPAEKLNAIFEKFFRMDEARSTNTGGAGLGLAIAKEIVTLHGGTINASSENEMTTFSVTLPLY
ncbi:sensor histidine kinase [bacterium 1xD42-62]|uniref:histidine kinase n=1 Tax=Parablautia muri TaxID=2320879 RepID=A0A9X5BEZ9_9FIRM|nr:HAMP domain-containing sensor histidine kinase [Parablautia muri]NBJ92824.1 sensor histidine kinase [Parablautia muri]